MTDLDDLRAAIARELPGTLDDLASLVAIPSVSMMPGHAADVDATAAMVAGFARDLGWSDVRVLSAGGKPAVVARYPAPEGRPTVVLYAHHDVQPTGDPAQWTSDPYTVTRRGDRLYGRGVVDNKGGIAVHLAALRAFGGRPPVGVTLFIEGEEESGSPSMAAFLDAHGRDLVADAFIVCDSGNWGVGKPGVTSTLRGLADVVVEVRTLDHAVHSGSFGGIAPDALTTLCRLLGTLWDDDGAVAIEGLVTCPVADLEYSEGRIRSEAGVLDGVSLIGRGSVVERLWGRPSVTVIGLDATPVASASNTLIPVARAKISLRIAPTQDAPAALQALKDHLLAHAPFGARVTIVDEGAAGGTVLPLDGPIAAEALRALGDAFGVEPVVMGQGGSIPLAADLLARYPGAAVLLTGVDDPDSRMHGIDESVDLSDLENAAVAEALFLARLGGAG